MNFSQLGFGFFVLKINGLLLAITFFLVAWHYFRTLSRKNFSTDFFAHHFWRWVVAALVLGRFFALFLELDIFARHGWWAPVVFWDGEINFWGAAIGFLVLMAMDLKRQKYSFLRWLDVAIPSILLGFVLADLIQFFTGSVYGTETNFFLGVQYETFGVETLAPVHPVTLYALIPHLLLTNIALKKQPLWERLPGRLTFVIGICVFLLQFLLEFWHGNPTVMLGETFRIGQAFSLTAIILCIFGLLRRR